MNQDILRLASMDKESDPQSFVPLNRVADWTSLYHTSPSRSSILVPVLPYLKSPVLEIGAGMGAITRPMADAGFVVNAIERSPVRAQIVRQRCRDLKNVKVQTDAPVEASISERFGTVVLVGVLEYAPEAAPECSPYDACAALLNYARSMLRPDGHLILAIENQLGMQYLNGAPEDHNGLPYFGVEDRYASDGPVTFGRQQLRRMLLDAGFVGQEWFYPFPDYKFPSCILTESGASPQSPSSPVALLRRADRLGTLRAVERSFRLALSWRVIWRNGLLADLSNSFLIAASPSAIEVPQSRGILGWVMPALGAIGDSGQEPVQAASIPSQSDGGLASSTSVIRELAPVAAVGSSVSYRQNLSHVDRLIDLLDSKATTEADEVLWLHQWLAAVSNRLGWLSESVMPDREIPSEAMDLVPPNLFDTPEGFRFHGLRLPVGERLSGPRLDWLLYRGLLHSLLQARQAGSGSQRFRGASVREVMMRLGAKYLPDLNSPRMATVRLKESYLFGEGLGHDTALVSAELLVF